MPTPAHLGGLADQLEARGVHDPRIIHAVRAVQRRRPGPRVSADDVCALALMLQAAAITPGQRVLEIGTGRGYLTLLMAYLGAQVFTVERDAEVLDAARPALDLLAARTVRLRVGDGTLGWPEQAPYDAIVAGAACATVPAAWMEQLTPGGCIVSPVGPPHRQELLHLHRTPWGSWQRRSLLVVAFEPLS